MKAITQAGPGGPETLTLGDVLKPARPSGHVLLKVDAAGVNRPDVLQRMGFYPPPPGVTDIIGLEVAGTVVEADESRLWKEGDHVMALLPGGGYAEYASVDARHCLPLPEGLTATQAAGIPETLFTVWANVMEAGAFSAGDRVLVHGATSGIGTMAGQLITALGGVAIGTAGSPEKVAAAQAAGYAKVFDYKSEKWEDTLRDEGGVDIVLDMVGGDYVPRNLSCLKPKGRHVTIAVQGGAEATVNFFQVMRNRWVLTGSTMRARDADEKARLTNVLRKAALPLFSEGRITPLIDRTFSLADAAAAHAHMESGSHVGKIILTA